MKLREAWADFWKLENWHGPASVFLVLGLLVAVVLAGCQTSDHPLLRACQDYTGAHDAFVEQAELGTFDLATLEKFQEATTVPTAICLGDHTNEAGEPLTVDGAIARVREAYFTVLKLQQVGDPS